MWYLMQYRKNDSKLITADNILLRIKSFAFRIFKIYKLIICENDQYY